MPQNFPIRKVHLAADKETIFTSIRLHFTVVKVATQKVDVFQSSKYVNGVHLN
jgi:hypothetical protein